MPPILGFDDEEVRRTSLNRFAPIDFGTRDAESLIPLPATETLQQERTTTATPQFAPAGASTTAITEPIPMAPQPPGGISPPGPGPQPPPGPQSPPGGELPPTVRPPLSVSPLDQVRQELAGITLNEATRNTETGGLDSFFDYIRSKGIQFGQDPELDALIIQKARALRPDRFDDPSPIVILDRIRRGLEREGTTGQGLLFTPAGERLSGSQGVAGAGAGGGQGSGAGVAPGGAAGPGGTIQPVPDLRNPGGGRIEGPGPAPPGAVPPPADIPPPFAGGPSFPNLFPEAGADPVSEAINERLLGMIQGGLQLPGQGQGFPPGMVPPGTVPAGGTPSGATSLQQAGEQGLREIIEGGGFDPDLLFDVRKSLRENLEGELQAGSTAIQEQLAERGIARGGTAQEAITRLDERLRGEMFRTLRDVATNMGLSAADRQLSASLAAQQLALAQRGQELDEAQVQWTSVLSAIDVATSRALGIGDLGLRNLGLNLAFQQTAFDQRLQLAQFVESARQARQGNVTGLIQLFLQLASQFAAGAVKTS